MRLLACLDREIRLVKLWQFYCILLISGCNARGCLMIHKSHHKWAWHSLFFDDNVPFAYPSLVERYTVKVFSSDLGAIRKETTHWWNASLETTYFRHKIAACETCVGSVHFEITLQSKWLKIEILFCHESRLWHFCLLGFFDQFFINLVSIFQ